MKVFVSYTLKDPAVTREKLEQVEAKLKPFSKVFIDLLHNEKGKQRRVEWELRNCDVVLQLLSPKYQSDWVQKEILAARKKNKPIIKVGIDELLKKDQEQVFLMLSDVDKKGWSVWAILMVSLLVCVGISILGIWLSYLYVGGQEPAVSKDDILNARGLFGDSWGGVNAIISAVAFAGVIVTLFLQNRDLNLQRKEMARQREEFEKENDTLKYQRFENLFYNMLNLQQEIVAGLKFDYEEEGFIPVTSGPDNLLTQERKRVIRSVSGREVFQYLFRDVKIGTGKKDNFGNPIYIYGYRGYLNECGLEAYDETRIPSYFDHYFRHLYKIIQFVDNQGFPFEEAYKYVSLFRGTLSRYELVWIYYNALSFEKIKKLIEKYSLLKNMREDLLTLSAEAESYYNTIRLSQKDLFDNGFSGSDYEFYLTDDLKDVSKLYLTAFRKIDEIDVEQDRLNRWRALVKEAEEKMKG